MTHQHNERYLKLDIPLFWDRRYADSRKKTNGGILAYKDGEWSNNNINQNVDCPKLTFSLENGEFRSPLSATFGGVYLPNDCTYSASEMIQALNNFFFINKIKRATILLSPDHLRSTNIIPIEDYMKNSWNVNFTDTNFYIEMKTWKPADLSKGNRKKIKQAISENLIFEEVFESEINSAYEVISRNRISLGVKVSLELDDLKSLMISFKEYYRCFVLKKPDGTLTASAFLVNTFHDNLYVYLWADTAESRHFSPIALMLQEIIRSEKDKFKFLDLGTASSEGQILEGLARFKINLGATATPKYSIKWES